MSRASLIAVVLMAAVAFAAGINWGLPSRDADAFLFADRQPWSGREILSLMGPRQGNGLGADVDRDPVPARDGPVVLNETDRQRAQIVLRYRLYSAQPDEMITFMSLADMRPRELSLDPKLYQYGGLWVYGVGAMIGTWLRPTSDLAFYLDHPEQFARFYVVARAYSAALGLIGAACVWWFVRRFTGSAVAGGLAGAAYALLPVVNNMAHEAKPHLPGSALMLLACVAGMKFVETGRGKWWVATAVLCGGAVSMILSAWPIVFVVPAMLLCRRLPWAQRLVIAAAAGVIAIDVYFAFNPYVLKHLLAWSASENPLRSNLANSRAMYAPAISWAGFADAARLLGYAATGVVALLGTIGAIVLVRGRSGPAPAERRDEGVPAAGSLQESVQWPARLRRAGVAILATPAVIVLAQFTLLAAGKPGEYARFALFPSIVLLMLALAGMWRLKGSWPVRALLVGLIVGRVAVGGASYVWHFMLDSQQRSTRVIAAERLRTVTAAGAGTLLVAAEPAPYCLPPVNLFRGKIVLAGKNGRAVEFDHMIKPVDVTEASVSGGKVWIRPRLLPTPISWAAKAWLYQSNGRRGGESLGGVVGRSVGRSDPR